MISTLFRIHCYNNHKEKITSKITSFLLIIPFLFVPHLGFAMKFDEGIEYRVIQKNSKPFSDDNQQVLEFFGYFCPHCKTFSPVLKNWEKSLPKNITFTQLHVPFRDLNHQRLFFSLKSINSESGLHYKIFNSIQAQGNPLNNFLEILAWVESQGVDEKEFETAWNSEKVKSEMANATKLMKDYKIDSVPQLVINGKYLTSPAMVGGSHKRVIKVVEYLLEKK